MILGSHLLSCFKLVLKLVNILPAVNSNVDYCIHFPAVSKRLKVQKE